MAQFCYIFPVKLLIMIYSENLGWLRALQTDFTTSACSYLLPSLRRQLQFLECILQNQGYLPNKK